MNISEAEERYSALDEALVRYRKAERIHEIAISKTEITLDVDGHKTRLTADDSARLSEVLYGAKLEAAGRIRDFTFADFDCPEPPTEMGEREG